MNSFLVNQFDQKTNQKLIKINQKKLDQQSNLQPTNLQPQVDIRPETAKPKDPDSFDFKDEQVAKDYKKMWDKYNEMEALLKAKSEAENAEEEEDDDEEWFCPFLSILRREKTWFAMGPNNFCSRIYILCNQNWQLIQRTDREESKEIKNDTVSDSDCGYGRELLKVSRSRNMEYPKYEILTSPNIQTNSIIKNICID